MLSQTHIVMLDTSCWENKNYSLKHALVADELISPFYDFKILELSNNHKHKP